MRESGTGVERGVVSGLESRSVSAFGGGVSTDRGCRVSQIGNCKVSIETSDGRFSSDCRLTVSKDSKSHFIFLDRNLVLWLEGVLHVASSKNWKLPSSCESLSPRRKIAVHSFVSAGLRFLKISEICTNGKLFFVLIPSSTSFEGWRSFLSTLQSWIAAVLAPPPPSAPPGLRSLADVVKGPSLSMVGRCVSLPRHGSPGVLVENDGIQERLAYLDRCLVFRFRSKSVIDWVRFRRWASRNWDCALNSPIHKMDDDIWLLFCDSQAKVERILSLNRTIFNGVQILLDKWIPEAGLSNVLLKEGVIWITIRGIPIHLRSSDLFRQLGAECGEFMGYEICSSLSSVRLRIKPSTSLPNEILVKSGDSSFTVRVIPDQSDFSPPHDTSSGPRPVFHMVGKGELTPIPAYHFGSPAVLELGSTSVVSQSASETPALQNLPLCPVTAVTSSEIFEARKEKVAIPMIERVKAPKVSDRCGLFVGLSLEIKEDLWLVRAHGLNRTPLFKFSLDVGKGNTCLK
ncbi:hypothetical protein LINPERHAP2_LOCUS34446 [Linum perenne]